MRRPLRAVAAAAALTLLALPAVATASVAVDGPSEPLRRQLRERARQLLVDVRQADPPPSSVREQGTLSALERFTDPADDVVRTTFRLEDDTEPSTEPADYPAADLRSYSVETTPTELRVTATVAEPLTPSPDPAEGGPSPLVTWFVSTSEDPTTGGLAVVSLAVGPDGLVADLTTEGPGGGTVSCPGEGALVDGVYVAARLPIGCVADGPDAQLYGAAGVSVLIPPQGPDDDTLVSYDDSAPDGFFVEPGEELPALDGPVAVEAAPEEREPGRLAGPDRFATAVAISAERFDDGAPVVYLSRADLYPDALAAGTLDDGPTLLVPSCGPVPEVVLRELRRLAPRALVVLGSRRAVCERTVEQAVDATGVAVEEVRLAGPDRYDTAVAVSRFAFPEVVPPEDGFPGFPDTVYLVSGQNFPDALAAGVLGSPEVFGTGIGAADDSGPQIPRTGAGPILLAPRCGELPQSVAAELRRLAPVQLVAVGGRDALCDEVVQAANTAANVEGTNERLAVQVLFGENRYQTAAEVARYSFPLGATEVYLAVGSKFPDALAGGKLVRGPILLVPEDGELPRVVVQEIARLNPTRVVALGSDTVVSDRLLAEATGAEITVVP